MADEIKPPETDINTVSTDTESPNPDNRREVLEAAWDHIEGWNKEHIPEPAKPAEAKPAEPKLAPAAPVTPAERDATGRFKPRVAAAAQLAQPSDKPPATRTPGAPAPAVPATPSSAGTAGAPLRAPASFRPLAREQWDKTPPAVQQEVVRRDREVSQVLQRTAQAREFADEWTRMLEPHAQFIRSSGRTPVQLVQSLFQTAGALAGGGPRDKAAVIANIMRAYGVGVEELATALDAGGPLPAGGAQPYQPQPAPYKDPRVDEIYGELGRMRAFNEQQAAQSMQAADADLETYLQSNPYAEEVLDEMADVIEAAHKRGVDMQYEQAYSVVINALRPDLAALAQAQQAAEGATTPEQGATARAEAAASSVKGAPGIKPASATMTRREALEAAWDLHESGGRV